MEVLLRCAIFSREAMSKNRGEIVLEPVRSHGLVPSKRDGLKVCESIKTGIQTILFCTGHLSGSFDIGRSTVRVFPPDGQNRVLMAV